MRRILPLASLSPWLFVALAIALAVVVLPVGAAPFVSLGIAESNTAILMTLGLAGLGIAGRPRSDSDPEAGDAD